MAANVECSTSDIPQWKKDLIARLRNQNRAASSKQQLSAVAAGPPRGGIVGRTGQQPGFIAGRHTKSVFASSSVCTVNGKCNTAGANMVQERLWLETTRSELKMPCESDDYEKYSDQSDSSEDLQYGPGIVNKLKNKYLSLALRQSNTRCRPSILHLRKATSLENMLDGDEEDDEKAHLGEVPAVRSRMYQTRFNGSNDTGRNATNRYRNMFRGYEMKRARSVETISRDNLNIESEDETRLSKESLHDDVVISNKEGSDKPQNKTADKIMSESTHENKPSYNKVPHNLNRPKRIAPLLHENEKPPADVVKQAKLIFEKRPEQRTRAPQVTGEVAAKVATYREIIVKAKASSKPPIKVKPVAVSNEKPKIVARTMKPPVPAERKFLPSKTANEKIISNKTATVEKSVPNHLKLSSENSVKSEIVMSPSPIPDVSRVESPRSETLSDGNKIGSGLSETPDLILTSSPISSNCNASPVEKTNVEGLQNKISNGDDVLDNARTSPSFNKSSIPSGTKTNNVHNKDVMKNGTSTKKTPIHHPLHLEINGFDDYNSKTSITPLILQIVESNGVVSPKGSPQRVLSPITRRSPPIALSPRILSPVIVLSPNFESPKVRSPVQSPVDEKSPKETNNKKENSLTKYFTDTEIEKNLKNKFKSLEQNKFSGCDQSADDVKKIVVPKPRRTASTESNCMEYNFTKRKGTPDYIRNDRSKTSMAKIEKPKPGESGVILLPGASIGDSFTDEDEEIMRSLEAPPSPCDVKFINDNILIDGKSSLCQKTKKPKMKISFVEDGPEIYEYPSENSLFVDETPSPVGAQVGQTVPLLSGSSLANYTPKGTEDFQPGITRTPTPPPKCETDTTNHIELEETEQPIQFSAGTNSDILF